ncbi:unnamed protein product, partial [Coregonus sp. 'balchen']
DAGRLLYLGQNEWAHVNCCLWSAEVYEDNGALLQRCERCGQAGATVGCCLSSCQSNYHFMCARARNCVFQEDRKVFCSRHRDLVSEKMVSGNGFDVLRRVYVDFEGISLRSLQINRLGVLTELSANGARLCPVGYQCSRLYWSTVDPRRRCKYTCKVTEVCSPLPEKPGEPLWWDQEENQTIAHSPSYYKEMEITEAVMSPPPIDVSPSTTSSPLKQEPGAKTPGYSQTRRPAGGTSRPLPSPDLDDTRRPRRLSLSCHSGDSSSPTDSLAGPMTLRSGGTLHPRSLPFSSPPRTSENLLSSHRRDLPFTTFDVADADVAVASVLNAKLEFDEALLNENVALHCGGSQTGGGDMEEEALEEETQSQTQGRDNMDANNKAPVLIKAMASKDDLENGSSDEDMDHYLKFSRTVVVCEASKDSGQAGLPLPPPPPTSQSIAQLDGADNGSESDSSEATGDQEETHEEGKSGEAQGADSQQVFETCDPNNDMSIEEEVLVDSDQTESQNEVLLDPSSGHFVSADDGTRVYLANNKKAALDDSDSDSSGSSTDSLTVSTSSPSYSRISQIAKMIHSSGALPRAVPQVVVVPSTSTPSPRTAVFHSSHLITSNRNNTTTPTTISNRNNTTPASNTNLLIRAPQSLHDGRVLVQAMPVTSEPVRVKCVSVPGNQAQAILDRAMATHREPTRIRPNILRVSPSHLSPSQFQVQPFFNKLQSPVAISAAHGQMLRHEPATVPESHSQSQVRVKRVSSVAERPGKKKCKTDFLPQSPSCDLDDLDGSRNSGVRIKAPTMKDVLDLDQEKVELKVISPPEPEKIRPPPIPQMDRPPSSSTTQSSSNIHGKTHVWVSARHGDLSDWGPYSVAWRAVTDGVLEARAGFHLKALPLGGVSGARVLGLLHDAVIFILEQLQGAAGCKQHRFRFHRYDTLDDELPINPSGCARAEVYSRKSTFDMFNFLASQHRQLPDIIRATSTELPMAMRFRHLEKTSKEAVGVYRSEIHGRGLFCKRNIEAGEMVIEYAGNVIRAVLTDKKEKYYDSKGIGCYMFRIDDFDVVDATMHGNAARFINHSCEPNCYSRVILVDSHKHIVIFALRKIYRGEELTYDYKFPIEDDGSKLHCNCAARRCRRFLN